MEGAAVYYGCVGNGGAGQRLAVEGYAIDVDRVGRGAVGSDYELFARGKIVGDAVEKRRGNLIFRQTGTKGMEA